MILEQIKAAIDGDSIPAKNIALRRAYDEIVRLAPVEEAARGLVSNYRKAYGRVTGAIRQNAPMRDELFKLNGALNPLLPANHTPTYREPRFYSHREDGFDGDKGREANDYPYGEEPGQ